MSCFEISAESDKNCWLCVNSKIERIAPLQRPLKGNRKIQPREIVRTDVYYHATKFQLNELRTVGCESKNLKVYRRTDGFLSHFIRSLGDDLKTKTTVKSVRTLDLLVSNREMPKCPSCENAKMSVVSLGLTQNPGSVPEELKCNISMT